MSDLSPCGPLLCSTATTWLPLAVEAAALSQLWASRLLFFFDRKVSGLKCFSSNLTMSKDFFSSLHLLSFHLYLTDSIKKTMDSNWKCENELSSFSQVLEDFYCCIITHLNSFLPPKILLPIKVPYCTKLYKIGRSLFFFPKSSEEAKKKLHGCPGKSTISHLKHLLDLSDLPVSGGWSQHLHGGVARVHDC